MCPVFTQDFKNHLSRFVNFSKGILANSSLVFSPDSVGENFFSVVSFSKAVSVSAELSSSPGICLSSGIGGIDCYVGLTHF